MTKASIRLQIALSPATGFNASSDHAIGPSRVTRL
jgi:hypothetical protein